MKKRLTGYSFDASAKTITHASFSDVTLEGIQLITNVTDQVIIYNFADTTKGGTLSTDTLTLEYDTTSMSDTDELMILVEDGAASIAVNDAGGSLTVDGSVTVTQGTATNLKTQAEAYQGGSAVASGNPLEVNLRSSTVGVATSAKQDTGNTSLASIDGKITACNTGAVVISSGSVTADTELTTADLDTGAGTDTRAVVGIVGSKSGGAQLIPGDATAGLKVDLGSDNDVTVTSISAGDNNIGNVDIVTVPADPFGANADAASATGSISAKLKGIATALGVTALDLGSGTGGSRTLRIFQDTAQFVGGTGTDTSATQRVSLATNVALPAGTNAIGKLAANSGVDIGDVDITSVVPGTGATNLGKAEDGGHTTGDVGVMDLGVRQDTPNTAISGTDGDYTPKAVTSTGAMRIAPISEDFAALANGPQVKKYYSATGATTDGIVWSPASGKRWYITDLIFTTSAAATVTFEDDKSGGDETVLAGDFAANSGLSHHFATPLFSGEDAADLMVTTSAGNIKVTVVGYEI